MKGKEKMFVNSNVMSVTDWAVSECVRQRVTDLKFVGNIVAALALAESRGLTPSTITIDDVKDVGKAVAPASAGWWRKTPVTFASGGSAASAQNVPRLMGNLVEMGRDLSTDEWVKEFLDIHPWEDGNGRTAAVLQVAFDGVLRPLTNHYGK